MRQRIKMAAALVHDPPVLILDEPFNGMDPRQRLHMFELLRQMAAEGRTVLLSSHILEEVERVADSVLVIYAGRLAASGDFRSIRRLMTDRPHVFRVRSTDDRQLATSLLAEPSVFGVELDPDRAHRAHLRLRAVHPADAGARAGRRHLPPRAGADRRIARIGLRLPGGPMIRALPVVAITLRNLVDRRRFWLMVLLAAVPVLIAIVGRAFADQVFSERIFDQLIIRTVLPLVALVFGTAALGTELEDGTIVFLLAKPIGRSRIVAAKGLVAAGLTALLVVPATILTGLVATTSSASMAGTSLAYALAVVVGGAAYTLAFLALSSFTSRALAVGLGYVLLWEGVLAGLFEGTRAFSIRQATLGLAAELQGTPAGVDTLAGTTSAVVLGAVIVGSLALGGWRLARYQMKGGD